MPAAVAYADVVNWQVGVKEFAHKSRVLAELCESAGRDPASLRRSHAPNFQIFDSEREFAAWRQDEQRGMSSEEVYAYIRNRGALYGTTSAIEETTEEFIDVGCGGFMVFCNTAPSARSQEQLAALPSVRRAISSNPRQRYESPGGPPGHLGWNGVASAAAGAGPGQALIPARPEEG